MPPADRFPSRDGLATLAVVAWLLLGVVASAPVGAASAGTGPTGHLADDDGGLLNGTLDATTDTVDSTTGTVESTVDATTDTVDSTTETTTGAVDETVDGTTDTVDSTTETTTGAVDETVDGTTGTLDTITGGATEPVTDGVDGTVDSTTDAVDATAGETTETVDATAETSDELANATTTAGTSLAEGDLSGTTGALGDAVAEVGTFTTERTTSLVETTGAVTTTTLTTLSGDSGLASAVDGSSVTDADLATEGGSSTDATVTTRAARDLERVEDRTTGAAVPSGDDAAVGEPGSESGGSSDGGSGSDAPLDGLLTALSGAAGGVSTEQAALGGVAAVLAGAAGVAARQSAAAGGSGAGAGLAATTARAGENALSRLVRMLSVFRYSRYDDSDPLELETRRAVYDAVREQPGEPITAVSDRADVNLSTARHHVRVLRDEGLIATARIRNCERFYPAGTDDVELAAAMADESTADILDALVRHEPASVSALADDVERSPSTVTHHLQKLEDDGIVVRERAGRSVENKLSEGARAALDPDTEAVQRPHAAELRMEAEAETEPEADASAGAHAD